MHLLKNIVEHIVRLVSGAEDSARVREEERSRKRFPGTWVNMKDSKLPAAPFRLTKKEAETACDRATSIQVPIGFGWKPQALFNSSAPIGMKSHSWKQLVATGILKYCLRGLLGMQQRQTLFRFFTVLAMLCCESVNVVFLEQLELDLHESLALLERDFPVSLHVIVFHLLHHLPFYLKRFGPPVVFWMYSLERFNSWIIRRVKNRRYPESTVVQTYLLFELSNFFKMSGEIPDNALVYYAEQTDGEDENEEHILPDMLSLVEFANLEMFYSPELRCKLSKNILKRNRFSYKDQYGRVVTWTSGDKEPSRQSVLSYVFTRLHDNSIIIGRIRFLFQHAINDKMHAYVQWFAEPGKDPETELLFVNLNSFSSLNPVTLVSSLSCPLVTAIDLQFVDKLWILSYIND